ncbi:DUF551 domain-containing protein [Klebsiella pneumoniae]|uniref:DUF551 domain-containing protein n=1 Tax=Klebsiella pneumoniae TaxID=573 RepID=UPI000E5C40A2|nr:DUF551 domain-containing protein [Klebsiella pneumoniae]
MTKSTITREQVIALIAEHSYDSALVDALEHLLATMNSEPVAFTEKHEISNMHATGIYLRAWPADRARNAVEGYTIPLYLHAQTELVVPDAIPKLEDGKRFKYVKDGIRYSVSYANGWNDCRAAMLQAGNHTEQCLDMVDHFVDANEKDKAGTIINEGNSLDGNSPVIPDGWVACSERLPPEGYEPDGGAVCYLVWHKNEVDCGPQYGISNVFFLRKHWDLKNFTHWMPLPNPPKE